MAVHGMGQDLEFKREICDCFDTITLSSNTEIVIICDPYRVSELGNEYSEGEIIVNNHENYSLKISSFGWKEIQNVHGEKVIQNYGQTKIRFDGCVGSWLIPVFSYPLTNGRYFEDILKDAVDKEFLFDRERVYKLTK